MSGSAPTTLKAFVAERGDDDVDRGLRTLEPDALGEGDVLVRVAYSSVNYKDALAHHPKGPRRADLAARPRHRPRRDGRRVDGDEIPRGPRSSRTAMDLGVGASRRLRRVRARARRLGRAPARGPERPRGDVRRHGGLHGRALGPLARAPRDRARDGPGARDRGDRRRGLERRGDARGARLRGGGLDRQGRGRSTCAGWAPPR